MAFDRIVGLILRAAELAFAAIVAGVNGWYLDKASDIGVSSWDLGRFIYTEVVAALAILFSLLWLLPFEYSFAHYPFDLFMSILWFVAFGLLVDLIGNSCGYVFDWNNVSPRGDLCGRWKADYAFCFLSAICWLASSILGFFFMRDHVRARWYGSRTV